MAVICILREKYKKSTTQNGAKSFDEAEGAYTVASRRTPDTTEKAFEIELRHSLTLARQEKNNLEEETFKLMLKKLETMYHT